MSHIDIQNVSFRLPDGRPLLDGISFRVPAGQTTALIGQNGAGKTTLMRIVRGDTNPHGGVVSVDGSLGAMDQFVGHGAVGQTVHDLLIEVSPGRIARAARELGAAENAVIENDVLDTQLRYASAIADYADAGGYEYETVWDTCTIAALGVPFERARFRELVTLSAGEQKRLALEALLRGSSRPTTSTSSPRKLSKGPLPPSRGRCSPSPTIAGSPDRSTGSSCSGPTERSASRMHPSGTRSV